MKDWTITYQLTDGTQGEWLAVLCVNEIGAMTDFLSHCVQQQLKPAAIAVKPEETNRGND